MKATDWNFKYFGPDENWGDTSLIRIELVSLLNSFREKLGLPVAILCGTQGKHVINSEHYTGEAVDICVPNNHYLLDLLLCAVRFKFESIGIYPDWQYQGQRVGGLHLGIRSNPFMHEWIGVNINGSQVYLPLNTENLEKYGVI